MDANVRELFQDVAGLPTIDRREQYSRRKVSPAVRADVESLLGFDETGGDSVAALVGSATEHFFLSNAPVSEDGRCGPFRLLKLLGNGGMGAVYLAERADGEVDQKVAIKFIHTGTDAFRERFLRERQILASLNHTGIARLIDAGHSAGQPYLVMEYVDGTRIDRYAAPLESREIVALMIRVAEAVSYAHRNLVIHRDLKPSNILVDAAGQPKLLDFGIAKIAGTSEQTCTLDRMMTPEYASPEQRNGDVQSTATDVYSLGAVLQKLLTLSTLSHDLASIVAKAMRQEPDERYPSVDAFIADLRAFLDHRPVQALSGNALYLTRKFVRRFWLPLAAATLATSGLAIGFVVANRERAVAQYRFEQVRQLANQFFALDAEIRSLPGSTKARSRIVAASLEYLERLGSKPDKDLAFDVGTAYMKVARVQGVPTQTNLGQFKQASASLAKADTIIDGVLAGAGASHRRKSLLASAEIAADSMILAESEHRNKEAAGFASRAIVRLDELLRGGAFVPSEASTAARIYVNVAMTQQKLNRRGEALANARRSVSILRGFDSDPSLLSQCLGVLANTARFEGDLNTALQAIQESRALAEKGFKRDDVAGPLRLSAALWREGVLLGELNNINLGREREGAVLLQRAFDIAESLAQKDSDDYTSRSYVSMAGRELGDVLRDTDPARSLAIYDLTYRRLDEVDTNLKARRDQVWLLAGSSYSLRNLGRNSEAQQRIDAAIARLQELKNYPVTKVQLGSEIDCTLRAQADHLAGTGRTAEAIRAYEDLLAKVQAANPRFDSDLNQAANLARLYRDLARLYGKAGRSAEAQPLMQRRLEVWQQWDRKLPNNVFVRRQLAAAQLT